MGKRSAWYTLGKLALKASETCRAEDVAMAEVWVVKKAKAGSKAAFQVRKEQEEDKSIILSSSEAM